MLGKKKNEGSKTLVGPSPPASCPSYRCHHGLGDSSLLSPGDELEGRRPQEGGEGVQHPTHPHTTAVHSEEKSSAGTGGSTQRWRRRNRRTKRGSRQVAAQASPHHLLQLPCPQIRGFWGLLSFLEGFPPAERHPLSPHTASRAGDIPLEPRAGGTCPRGEHPGVPPPSPVGAP